jgi:hypothetical protein
MSIAIGKKKDSSSQQTIAQRFAENSDRSALYKVNLSPVISMLSPGSKNRPDQPFLKVISIDLELL